MPGLEVSLNGEKLCTTSLVAADALNATIDVLGPRNGSEVTLRVAGLDKEMFVVWCDRNLRVGDEVTIRIVETEVVDPPLRRVPSITGPDAEPSLEM